MIMARHLGITGKRHVRHQRIKTRRAADCNACVHKGTDFYYGLCPQNDDEVLPDQEGNNCGYFKDDIDGLDVIEEASKNYLDFLEKG